LIFYATAVANKDEYKTGMYNNGEHIVVVEKFDELRILKSSESSTFCSEMQL